MTLTRADVEQAVERLRTAADHLERAEHEEEVEEAAEMAADVAQQLRSR